MALVVSEVVTNFVANLEGLFSQLDGLTAKLEDLSSRTFKVRFEADNAGLNRTLKSIDNSLKITADAIQGVQRLIVTGLASVSERVRRATGSTQRDLSKAAAAAGDSVSAEAQAAEFTLIDAVENFTKSATKAFLTIGGTFTFLAFTLIPDFVTTLTSSADGVVDVITKLAQTTQGAVLLAISGIVGGVRTLGVQTTAIVAASGAAIFGVVQSGVLGTLGFTADAVQLGVTKILTTVGTEVATFFTFLGTQAGKAVQPLLEVFGSVFTFLGTGFATFSQNVLNALGIVIQFGTNVQGVDTAAKSLSVTLGTIGTLSLALVGFNVLTGLIVRRVRGFFTGVRPNTVLGKAAVLINVIFDGLVKIATPATFIVNRFAAGAALLTTVTGLTLSLASGVFTVGTAVFGVIGILGTIRPLISNLFLTVNVRLTQVRAALGDGTAQFALLLRGVREGFQAFASIGRQLSKLGKGFNFLGLIRDFFKTLKDILNTLLRIADAVTLGALGLTQAEAGARNLLATNVAINQELQTTSALTQKTKKDFDEGTGLANRAILGTIKTVSALGTAIPNLIGNSFLIAFGAAGLLAKKAADTVFKTFQVRVFDPVLRTARMTWKAVFVDSPLKFVPEAGRAVLRFGKTALALFTTSPLKFGAKLREIWKPDIAATANAQFEKSNQKLADLRKQEEELVASLAEQNKELDKQEAGLTANLKRSAELAGVAQKNVASKQKEVDAIVQANTRLQEQQTTTQKRIKAQEQVVARRQKAFDDARDAARQSLGILQDTDKELRKIDASEKGRLKSAVEALATAKENQKTTKEAEAARRAELADQNKVLQTLKRRQADTKTELDALKVRQQAQGGLARSERVRLVALQSQSQALQDQIKQTLSQRASARALVGSAKRQADNAADAAKSAAKERQNAAKALSLVRAANAEKIASLQKTRTETDKELKANEALRQSARQSLTDSELELDRRKDRLKTVEKERAESVQSLNAARQQVAVAQNLDRLAQDRLARVAKEQNQNREQIAERRRAIRQERDSIENEAKAKAGEFQVRRREIQELQAQRLKALGEGNAREKVSADLRRARAQKEKIERAALAEIDRASAIKNEKAREKRLVAIRTERESRLAAVQSEIDLLKQVQSAQRQGQNFQVQAGKSAADSLLADARRVADGTLEEARRVATGVATLAPSGGGGAADEFVRKELKSLFISSQELQSILGSKGGERTEALVNAFLGGSKEEIAKKLFTRIEVIERLLGTDLRKVETIIKKTLADLGERSGNAAIKANAQFVITLRDAFKRGTDSLQAEAKQALGNILGRPEDTANPFQKAAKKLETLPVDDLREALARAIGSLAAGDTDAVTRVLNKWLRSGFRGVKEITPDMVDSLRSELETVVREAAASLFKPGSDPKSPKGFRLQEWLTKLFKTAPKAAEPTAVTALKKLGTNATNAFRNGFNAVAGIAQPLERAFANLLQGKTLAALGQVGLAIGGAIMAPFRAGAFAKDMILAGGNIVMLLGKGLKNAGKGLFSIWSLVLGRSIKSQVPQSPPPLGPLAGNFLQTAGGKIVKLLSLGVLKEESTLALVANKVIGTAFLPLLGPLGIIEKGVRGAIGLLGNLKFAFESFFRNDFTRALVEQSEQIANIGRAARRSFGDRAGAIQQFDAFRQAMILAKVEATQVETVLLTLNRNIAEAASGNIESLAFFERMGVNIQDVQSGAVGLDDVFLRLQRAFQEVKAAGGDTQEILDKVGANLLNVRSAFEGGSEAIRESMRRIRESGSILTDEDVKKAEEFEKQVTEIGLVWEGIQRQVLGVFFPRLVAFGELVRNVWIRFKDQILTSLDAVAQVVGIIFDILFKKFALWIQQPEKFFDDLTALFQGFLAIAAELAVSFFTNVIPVGIAAITTIFSVVGPLLEAAFKTIFFVVLPRGLVGFLRPVIEFADNIIGGAVGILEFVGAKIFRVISDVGFTVRIFAKQVEIFFLRDILNPILGGVQKLQIAIQKAGGASEQDIQRQIQEGSIASEVNVGRSLIALGELRRELERVQEGTAGDIDFFIQRAVSRIEAGTEEMFDNLEIGTAAVARNIASDLRKSTEGLGENLLQNLKDLGGALSKSVTDAVPGIREAIGKVVVDLELGAGAADIEKQFKRIQKAVEEAKAQALEFGDGDLLKKLEELGNRIEETGDTTGDMGKAFDKSALAIENLRKQVEQDNAFRQASQSIRDLKTQIVDLDIEATEGAGFFDKLFGSVDTIGPKLEKIELEAKGKLDQIAQSFGEAEVQILETVFNLNRQLAVATATGQTELQKALQDKIATLTAAREDFAKQQELLIKKTKEQVEKAKQDLKELPFKDLSETVGSAFSEGLTTALQDAFEGKKVKFKQLLGGIFSDIRDSLSKQFIDSTVKSLQKSMTTMFSEVFSFAGDLAGDLANGVLFVVSSLLAAGEQEVQAVKEQIDSVVESTERVRGIISGETTVKLKEVQDNLREALVPTNAILQGIRRDLQLSRGTLAANLGGTSAV